MSKYTSFIVFSEVYTERHPDLHPASQFRSCDLRHHVQAAVSLSFLTCKMGVMISLGCSKTRRYLYEVQWMLNNAILSSSGIILWFHLEVPL